MGGLLTENERAAITAAVARAERDSGAEIVPVLLPACGAYPAADARAAAFGALGFAFAFALIPAGALGWGPDPRWLTALAVALGALAGLALARLGALRRLLAGAELDQRVDLVAAHEFLGRNVFRTRDRSGILLLVSLFERRVRVLADEAVYGAVERSIWERLAADVAREMRAGSPGAALLRAVESAGELVVKHGPHRAPDDRNELPDAPVEERFVRGE